MRCPKCRGTNGHVLLFSFACNTCDPIIGESNPPVSAVKVLTTVKDVVKALREGKVVRRIYPMDNTMFEFVRVHNGVYEYKNPYHPEWDSCLDQPPRASLEDWAIFNLNWPCLLHPEDQ